MLIKFGLFKERTRTPCEYEGQNMEGEKKLTTGKRSIILVS